MKAPSEGSARRRRAPAPAALAIPAEIPRTPSAPKLPHVNPGLAKEALTRFIQFQVRAAGARGVVIGLSGGIDSAVTAALCAEALGPSSVLGLYLPSPTSRDEDRRDALGHAAEEGIAVEIVPLAGLLETYEDLSPGEDRLREGNFTARLRMALLYDRSARERSLVAGTANKTEALLGYTTLWGDMAAAFAPLGDLYKTQVRTLAEHLGVTAAIRAKAPSAGLWAGQTDEADLGATYEELDSLLFHYVDLRYDLEALAAAGFDLEFARRTISRVHANEFKRRMPLIPKLSYRTVGHDWLYPRHWVGPEGTGSAPSTEATGAGETDGPSVTAPSA